MQVSTKKTTAIYLRFKQTQKCVLEISSSTVTFFKIIRLHIFVVSLARNHELFPSRMRVLSYDDNSQI